MKPLDSMKLSARIVTQFCPTDVDLWIRRPTLDQLNYRGTRVRVGNKNRTGDRSITFLEAAPWSPSFPLCLHQCVQKS